MLEQFQQAHEDFAIIVNEYSLVVGVITLNDVMSTVMGDLVGAQDEEQQIVKRDENSWLIDGVTPVQDVQRALDIEELPHADEYETLAGFLMVMLRRVPERTDSVTWAGYTFEVLDVDSYTHRPGDGHARHCDGKDAEPRAQSSGRSLKTHNCWLANTAFGYGARPRLPL